MRDSNNGLVANRPAFSPLHNDDERAPCCAGYVNELTHGRFGDMSTGEKFGTAMGGAAIAGILYEVSARRKQIPAPAPALPVP